MKNFIIVIIILGAIGYGFLNYHFIDLDGQKISYLKELTKTKENVEIYEGDCNEILLEKVFTKVQYSDFRRGLCLLDPYGLHLDWEVIAEAGKMKTIEIFLNFPIMDMNRNTIWRNFEKVPEENIKRMNSYWGDESWKENVRTGYILFLHFWETRAGVIVF